MALKCLQRYGLIYSLKMSSKFHTRLIKNPYPYMNHSRCTVYNPTLGLTYNWANLHSYNTFLSPYENTSFSPLVHPSHTHISSINTLPHPSLIFLLILHNTLTTFLNPLLMKLFKITQCPLIEPSMFLLKIILHIILFITHLLLSPKPKVYLFFPIPLYLVLR